MEAAPWRLTGRKPYRARLYFNLNTARLPRQKKRLKKYLMKLKSRQIARAIVIGHTDTMGWPNQYNIVVRTPRLNEFAKSLSGVEYPKIYYTKGMANQTCLLKLGDEVAEARNRRVESTFADGVLDKMNKNFKLLALCTSIFTAWRLFHSPLVAQDFSSSRRTDDSK